MRISKEKRDAIIRCYECGIRIETLAVIAGMSLKTVTGIVNANNRDSEIKALLYPDYDPSVVFRTTD